MTKTLLSGVAAVSAAFAFSLVARADIAPPPVARRVAPAPRPVPVVVEKKPAGGMEARAPIAPPAPPPKARPTPAPELLEAARTMRGTWKCTGTMFDMATMTQKPATATVTWKLDLDSFWLVGTIAVKKSKDFPHPMKGTNYRAYNAATKQWVSVMVDNMGGYGTETAGAAANGVMTFEGESTMGAMKAAARDKEEIKSAKEMALSGEMKGPTGQWMPMYTMNCKK
jgi:hypothetical protein